MCPRAMQRNSSCKGGQHSKQKTKRKRGSYSKNWKFRGGGWWGLREIPSVVGLWISSGTTRTKLTFIELAWSVNWSELIVSFYPSFGSETCWLSRTACLSCLCFRRVQLLPNERASLFHVMKWPNNKYCNSTRQLRYLSRKLQKKSACLQFVKGLTNFQLANRSKHT